MCRRLVRKGTIDQGRPMKHNLMRKLSGYAKFVFENRRVIGAFVGSALMFAGYTREANFVHQMSSIE